MSVRNMCVALVAVLLLAGCAGTTGKDILNSQQTVRGQKYPLFDSIDPIELKTLDKPPSDDGEPIGGMGTSSVFAIKPPPKAHPELKRAFIAVKRRDFETANPMLVRHANGGDTWAQALLGTMLMEGKGIAMDPQRGLVLLRRSAEGGNFVGMYELGRAYVVAEGIKRNYVEAAKWLRKSAVRELGLAYFGVGLLYYRGWGVNQDTEAAESCFRNAMELGVTEGRTNLRYFYFWEKAISPDVMNKMLKKSRSAIEHYDNGQYGDALTKFRALASNNNSIAQNYLGFMHSRGQGVKQSPSMAVKYYRRAAQKGVRSAQFNLALAYATGRGVQKNQTQAFEWYYKAALQNYSRAAKAVADYYAEGLGGVDKDLATAALWYAKAEE
jgi:uncharacterized protein